MSDRPGSFACAFGRLFGVSAAYYSYNLATSQDPLTVAGAIQKAIWSVDPEEPIRSSATIEQLAQDSLMSRRMHRAGRPSWFSSAGVVGGN